LAYLKFCCKVQGIRNELFASDSCTVTSLDDIKNYFPPETNFEEYWPAKVVDTQLLTNQKSAHANPPGAWIRAPPEVPAPENTISRTLTAPAPVISQSIPVMMSNYQNGWPANQMVCIIFIYLLIKFAFIFLVFKQFKQIVACIFYNLFNCIIYFMLKSNNK